MKNIIEIDVNNSYYFTVENVDDGTNSIMVHFANHSDTGRCEIYRGDLYHTEVHVDDDGMITVPAQAYMDTGLVHLRYENGTTTCFLHLISAGNRFNNLIVKKVSGCVATIGGNMDENVTDYALALAKIISNHTKNTSEDCYKDLNAYRKSLILSLKLMGTSLQLNSTVSDIAVAAKDLDTDMGKLAKIISEDTDGNPNACYKDLNEYRKDMVKSLEHLGADIEADADMSEISEQTKAVDAEITAGKEDLAEAITSKEVETTSNESLSEMAANVRKIQTGGSAGGSGSTITHVGETIKTITSNQIGAITHVGEAIKTKVTSRKLEEKFAAVHSNGNSWVDTGIKAKDTIKIQLKFKMDKMTGINFVGMYVDPANALRFFGYNDRFYLDYNGESGRCMHGFVDITKTFEYELGNCYIKDLKTSEILAENSKQTFDFSLNENNILLFSSEEIGDIYYCKIYDGDTLVRDFVPKCDADGKPKLYDNVSNTYFETKGTEDFTAIKELS